MHTIQEGLPANVIKLRIDSYQGIQTKCMPFCATGSRLYVMSTGA